MFKNAPQDMDAFKNVTAAVSWKDATPEELKASFPDGTEIPDGYLAGWASTPDIDLYEHSIKPGAFDASIKTRGLTGPRAVKLLLNHDPRQVAGVIKKLETKAATGGLWIEAQLNLNLTYAKDALEQCRMLGGMNFSVGFSLDEWKIDKTADKREYLHILSGDLFEVSVVPFPGNEGATMEYVKSAMNNDVTSVAGFERWLVSHGAAKSRAEANKIVQMVKSNIALFQRKEESRGLDSDDSSKPVLAVEKIQKATSLVAELKSLLSS